MRLDQNSETSASSPPLAVTNGTRSSPHKPSLSGSTNGSVNQNGHQSNGMAAEAGSSAESSTHPSFYGHDREEVTRILIQSLSDLGYSNAAVVLSQESGCELEGPKVSAFRDSVLHGEWEEAEHLLFGSDPSRGGSGGHGGIKLVETANRGQMLFWIREQKFLELLERRDLSTALLVLRQELTPLNQETDKLHGLSSLIMCQSEEDMKSQAGWDGANGQSRHTLLSELSSSISPSVMVPEHRLATLLSQIKRTQISNCLYHNTVAEPSLYSDHHCDRNQFPLHSTAELERHSDEIWYLEFSHDGKRLATASKDRKVIVYSIPDLEILHVLSEHGDAVAFVAWSPDDTKLISCCRDNRARIWDTRTGACLFMFEDHTEPVTSCSWAPDGKSFVTGSLDRNMQLCAYDLEGKRIHAWPGGFRVQDCCITPDGQRLVVASTERQLRVFDWNTREEEFSLNLGSAITCISVSKDSKYLLVNMSDNEARLLDVNSHELIQQYLGKKQGTFVIRSGFGGANENFVISGSEDSKIYIWQRETGLLIETLEGHRESCVNAVSWNPTDPGMFASAGDDHRVQIWTKDTPSLSRTEPSNGFNR